MRCPSRVKVDSEASFPRGERPPVGARVSHVSAVIKEGRVAARGIARVRFDDDDIRAEIGEDAATQCPSPTPRSSPGAVERRGGGPGDGGSRVLGASRRRRTVRLSVVRHPAAS